MYVMANIYITDILQNQLTHLYENTAFDDNSIDVIMEQKKQQEINTTHKNLLLCVQYNLKHHILWSGGC